MELVMSQIRLRGYLYGGFINIFPVIFTCSWFISSLQDGDGE
jgi:hypothetical protein